jgi:hypothetical protein
MPRLHLLEIEDQPWCPAVIRDAATDFLQFAIHTGNNYEPVAPVLGRLLETAGTARIVDLCSGGGGPWPRLIADPALEREDLDVHLTDKYPNVEGLRRIVEGRANGRLRVHPEPVDAMAMPGSLTGLRTMFTAFHHFEPAAARAILHDAVETRQPIAIFESSERSPRGVLLMLLSPLFVLLSTPFIRPFRWSRLLWTYLIPVIPLVVLFDGIVSSLRTYSPEELRELAEGIGAKDYRWEAGTLQARGPIPVTYLIGTPV